MKKMALNILFILALIIGFNGCGGGGGSSDSTSISLTFPSDAVEAEPTQENAQEVAQTTAEQDPTADLTSYTINSVSNTKIGALQVSNQLVKIAKDKLSKIDTQTYTLNETINQTYSCDTSGSYSISGSGSETGGFTLTATFNQCNDYGEITNGSLRVSASNYSNAYEDYLNYNFQYLSTYTMTSGSYQISIAAGSYLRMTLNNYDTIYDTPSNYDLAISIIIEVDGLKYGIKDAVFNYDIDEATSTLIYTQTQGRFYLGTELAKYVDVDTSYTPPVEFTYKYGILESGSGHYIMDNNATLEINATGNNTYTATIDDNGTISTQSY